MSKTTSALMELYSQNEAYITEQQQIDEIGTHSTAASVTQNIVWIHAMHAEESLTAAY